MFLSPETEMEKAWGWGRDKGEGERLSCYVQDKASCVVLGTSLNHSESVPLSNYSDMSLLQDVCQEESICPIHAHPRFSVIRGRTLEFARQSLTISEIKKEILLPPAHAAEDLSTWILTQRGGRGLFVLWEMRGVKAIFFYLSKDTFWIYKFSSFCT